MSINYRELQDRDLAPLQSLMLELGYEVGQVDLCQNIAAIVNRGGQIIIAEDGEDVVGSICVIIDARLAEGIYAEIISLIVAASARGRGIGRELVGVAENWARGKVSKLRVRANAVRTDAHVFYEAQGFEHKKTQKVFIKRW